MLSSYATTCTYRCPMGTTVSSASAAGDPPKGASCQRSSTDPQRHPVAARHGSALARLARAVWSLEYGRQSLLCLAQAGPLDATARRLTAGGPGARGARLVA